MTIKVLLFVISILAIVGFITGTVIAIIKSATVSVDYDSGYSDTKEERRQKKEAAEAKAKSAKRKHNKFAILFGCLATA